MPQQSGWNVPNHWADLQEVGRRLRGAMGVRPARPGAPSLFGLQNSGAAPWEAPARAQTVPPVSGSPYVSPFAGSRQANLDRIKADPRYSVSAPGLGAPAPVVTPARRSRDAEINAASQQAGGPNLSKPLVPTEAELNAQKEYAAAREANPLAEVPELLDQRSAAYGQRAGIDQWLKAMQGGSKSDQEIARRFLAKQRREEPSAMQMDPAGTRAAFGSDLDVGPGAAALEGLSFKGGMPAATAEELKQAYQGQGQAAVPAGLSLDGLAYRAPAPVSQPAAMQADQAGLQQAFASGLAIAPQGSAQQSNLNGPDSPLVEANTSQSLDDQRKAFVMSSGSELLDRYRLRAGELNSYWRG